MGTPLKTTWWILHPSRWRTAAALAVVIVVANVTYVRNYGYPRGSFYDEAPYVADAQKYLNGTFFIADHPPLGKMLMALGERIAGANATNDQFVSQIGPTQFPDGFSFLGYRFLPVMLAWATAPVLFLIFLRITGRRWMALFLSALFLFDNALIVHLRGALLDGPLIFFSLLTILFFLGLWEAAPARGTLWRALAFGAAMALAVTTKEAGGILLLLPICLALRFPRAPKTLLSMLAPAALAFAVVFAGVWYVHFAIARHVNPALPNGGYFTASPAHRAVLQEGRRPPLSLLPVMVGDAYAVTASVNRTLVPLDLCNPKDAGSPVFFWPFGARAINYRMETSDNVHFRYLYLQSNPVVWGVGLLAVIASVSLLVASMLAPPARPLRHRGLLLVFTVMYVAYMGLLASMHRVLYLHAYLLPLTFTFVLAALVAAEVDQIGPFALTEKRKTAALAGVAVFIVAGWSFYKPFTYFDPLTNEQFQRRAIVRLWDLTCAHCPRGSGLVQQCGK
jgi:dolichyl-phosphate-mannose-protein mannosyltransferase